MSGLCFKLFQNLYILAECFIFLLVVVVVVVATVKFVACKKNHMFSSCSVVVFCSLPVCLSMGVACASLFFTFALN